MKVNSRILITGGGSGIGRATARYFAKQGAGVYIVGRRREKLEETAKDYKNRITVIQADISDESGREHIAHVVDRPLQMLLHNAAILGPITDLTSIPEKEWQQVQNINVNGPLFLTQALADRLHHARIMHVSSGAAHYPIASWGAYCVSKAALFMMYRMFREEHSLPGALFASLRPGIVDTEMQAHIRSGDTARFPHLHRFHEFYKNGALTASEEVARFIYWVFTATDDALFEAEEWDIRDERYSRKWRAATNESEV